MDEGCRFSRAKLYIRRVRYCSVVFSLWIFVSGLSAQQKAVQYTRDFEFRPGVYLAFADFKSNSPVPPAWIISDYNKSDRTFPEKILSKDSFTYTDSSGNQHTVKTNTVWGYCQGGTVYINHGTDFTRLNIIGSICHFLATVAVQTGGYDYYYNDPWANPYPRYMYVSSQFILDFQTGAVMDFNVPNMETLLQRDEELYQEFSSLKKKKKRDSIFLYLRRYNEKHPVYFPQ